MQTVQIIQILTDMKQLQQLGDIILLLYTQSHSLAPLREGCHTGDHAEYLVQLAQLTRGQLRQDPAVVKPV